ncbi:MAG: molecular chaperone DnaJ, partial [Clostridia bacterium]|nr:molecular chaperone DnaJ [Clostridia bacterium]
MKYKFFKDVDTVEELYNQYKKLAMQYHPDHGGRLEDMQQINAEYDELKKKVGNIHKAANGETYENESQSAEAP